jgi:hypothetical protein
MDTEDILEKGVWLLILFILNIFFWILFGYLLNYKFDFFHWIVIILAFTVHLYAWGYLWNLSREIDRYEVKRER